MSKGRKKLFDSLEAEDPRELHDFILSTETPTLEKIVHGIPAQNHQRLGELLYGFVRPLAEEIQSFEEDQPLPKQTLYTLKDVAILLNLYIKKSDNVAPVEIYEALCLMHGLLKCLFQLTKSALIFVLGATPEERNLQSSIAGCCELWYSQQREGYEAVVSQTITYLLLLSLEPNSKATDIKRLYDFRTSLALLDLDDLSSTDLCQLLQRTAIHPLFLVDPKGKKFLTYLFSINLGLIDKVHEAIQYSLISSKEWMVKAYAEIYFRAWRSAEGPFRIRIEYNCIQDYIRHSIHLKNSHLLKCSRIILGFFHTQKLSLKHIDSMLVDLYEPIIWRSLQVANPYVRRNAVVQLAIAFPLISDEWAASRVEEALQKQFELVQQLQIDPVPMVRAQAVRLTGHILTTFFDFVPTRVSQIYLSTLIHTLSKDQASADVRSAVVLAIDDMVKNPLTHSLLKEMLPDMCHVLHDNAERVRVHFIQLLLSIRASKGIKFYEIVDLDNLLARLEADKGTKVQRHITELLVDSYFPYAKKSAKQLIRRCVHMVKVNPIAAKKFYSLVPKLVPAGPIVKFMTKLWTTCIYEWIVRRKAAQELGEEYNEEVESERKAKKPRSSSSHIAVSDVPSVSTLFTILALCWDGILNDLEEKENEPLRTYLWQKFDESAFLTIYNDLIIDLESETEEDPNTALEDAVSELKHSVLKMAANLPATSVPSFATCVLPSLRPYTPTPVLTALLSALFSWNFQEQLVQMLTTWISSLINPIDLQDQDIDEENIEDLVLEEGKFGLSLLDILFNNDELRNSLLSQIECVSQIIHTLHPFISKIEARLSSKDLVDRYTSEGQREVPDQLLLASFELYYRLMLHVVALSSGDATSFTDLLAWGEEKVMPALSLPRDGDEGEDDSKKRKRDVDERLPDHEFAERTMYIIFSICGESIVTGTSDITFSREYISEACEILEANPSPNFAESIVRCTTKVMYNLYHGHKIEEGEEDGGGSRSEAERLRETCVKFFDFLLTRVSPKILAKSVKVTEFIALATQRSSLRPIVELFFHKVTEFLENDEHLQDDLISRISELSDEKLEDYLRWLIPTFLKSNVTMNVLSSYLTSKVLGTNPSLDCKWKTIQVISLLLNEGVEGDGGRLKKPKNFSPLQNLLISLIVSVADDEGDGENISLSAAEVKQKAEELLQLSNGAQ